MTTPETYTADVFCGNCSRYHDAVSVPCGSPVTDAKCPHCGVFALDPAWKYPQHHIALRPPELCDLP